MGVVADAIETARDAVEESWKGWACPIWNSNPNFFEQVAFSNPVSGYVQSVMSGLCGPRPTPTTQEIPGGQCEGVLYNVTGIKKYTNPDGLPSGQDDFQASGLVGPISGIGKENGRVIITHGNPLQKRDVGGDPSPATAIGSITSITRGDGLPDDCGNGNPGGYPPLTPQQKQDLENEPPRPPGLPPRPGGEGDTPRPEQGEQCCAAILAAIGASLAATLAAIAALAKLLAVDTGTEAAEAIAQAAELAKEIESGQKIADILGKVNDLIEKLTGKKPGEPSTVDVPITDTLDTLISLHKKVDVVLLAVGGSLTDPSQVQLDPQVGDT